MYMVQKGPGFSDNIPCHNKRLDYGTTPTKKGSLV